MPTALKSLRVYYIHPLPYSQQTKYAKWEKGGKKQGWRKRALRQTHQAIDLSSHDPLNWQPRLLCIVNGWYKWQRGLVGCIIVVWQLWAAVFFSIPALLSVWQLRLSQGHFAVTAVPLVYIGPLMLAIEFLCYGGLNTNPDFPWTGCNPSLLPAPTPVLFAKAVGGLPEILATVGPPLQHDICEFTWSGQILVFFYFFFL